MKKLYSQLSIDEKINWKTRCHIDGSGKKQEVYTLQLATSYDSIGGSYFSGVYDCYVSQPDFKANKDCHHKKIKIQDLSIQTANQNDI